VSERNGKFLGPGLAAGITEATPSILRDYEQALADSHSPLVRSKVSREEIMAHAQLLIDELVTELSGEAPNMKGRLASDIGNSRAAQGFHPGESRRAAGVLFEVVLRSVVAEATKTNTCAEAMLAVALTMNEVLMRALGVAADSYAQFQLDRIHSAHVEERRRISRELHDRIGHGVSLAHHNLELYEVYRSTRPLEAESRVASAHESLRETLEGVREVISDLRVAEPLDSMEKALRYFLDSAEEPDVQVHLKVSGDEHWAPPETRDEVFLILREALRNVYAHAEASAVLVRVQITPGELRGTVRDDGQGFDPAGVSGAKAGIVSMKERISLLGGTVSLTSRPGRGTTVDFLIPLRQD
jgi:signal transduction histidine kinase